ncbi:MAG: ATP-dependent RNA helicase HrpA, partial [Oleiphilaceae bacterium]|nr:ATP-dependent RNA helicase HrpA [Oleiphilaceae bacterium]
MSKSSSHALTNDLSVFTLVDQRRILRAQHHFEQAKDASAQEKARERLENLVAEAQHRMEQRKSVSPLIDYPQSLPVSQRAEEILKAVADNQVVIVAGETGSGKTTQLPKICLQAGLGRRGMIGHTQPRRLAARSVANRLAEEMQVPLGDAVGFQVRFNDEVSDRTLVKVMTDGILLSEIKHDPYLNKYDCLIIDEAHERSLNIDFLLGYLKRLLQKRRNLKLVITSATIDVERFSEHFDNAPIVQVEGRSFPVDIEYRPPFEQGEEAQGNLPEQITQTLEELIQEERQRGWGIGDVLVFLPGEREIREVAKHLRHQEWRDTEITPLYARLNAAEQQKIFSSHRGRRVVLATNVAETSITVPGIRYVIDPGLARVSRYSVRSKLQRLPVEAISQASANQRAGRCGRVAEGICYRLYSEEDFIGRPEFTDAEILRTNLAAVILKMLDLGLGDKVEAFPFIDPPDRRAWNDGFKLLFELGAVNEKHRLTKLGKRLAHLPVDPRLGRMLLEAEKLNSLQEVLVIVSALSIQDPRERPADKQQAADQAHAEYKDSDSDFISLLKLWQLFEEQRQELGSSQLKRYCQKRFLSYVRMREWRELHRQLLLACKQLGCVMNKQPADYEAVHKALLSGLLGHVGNHDEKREYKGCRNRRFHIFPGSALAKLKPKWLMAAELVETSQVYARICARIDVGWIEPHAKHLVKKSWSEPHWQKKRGQVVAYEKVTLYGLEIVARRPVNYGAINPAESREIFIRAALVEGEFSGKYSEIVKNQELIKTLEAIEDRTRKRDILVDDETIFSLYDQRISAEVVSQPTFDKWYRGLNEHDRQALCFSREELQREQAPDFDPGLFPDHLENNGIRFPLSYHFRPGELNDGVTLSIPVSAVRQLTAGRIERLVPGLLKEKCTQLIKHLPRT